jgi:hypothetical protein
MRSCENNTGLPDDSKTAIPINAKRGHTNVRPTRENRISIARFKANSS